MAILVDSKGEILSVFFGTGKESEIIDKDLMMNNGLGKQFCFSISPSDNNLKSPRRA
jgi:hypothetical protein